MKNEYRINVYAGEENREQIISRVRYNEALDTWNGNNWQNGGTGLHKGITKLKDGRYVIIIGSNWQGAKDYAYVVSPNEALQEILGAGKADLLETKKFAGLKELYNDSLVEEEDEEDE